MSAEKWLHVQEKAQNNNGISVLETEPCSSFANAEKLPHHSGLIGKWVDLKEENALNHTPSGESIIDQMIELEGTSVCQSIAEEDKMCKDMRKIEDPFVTDTKFKRLGGTFRRV